MSNDVYINAGLLLIITRAAGDLTGIPPTASLIDSAVWATMCKEAGGEAALIAALKVQDMREVTLA